MPNCVELDTSGTLEGVYDSNRWDSFFSVLLRDIAAFAVVCVWSLWKGNSLSVIFKSE